MSLSKLVNIIFENIGKPDYDTRNKDFIAPEESDSDYKRAWRISRAFSNIYPVKYDDSLNLTWGVTSYNDNMPLVLASYMQQLREGTIDPRNPEDVAHFQQMIASVSTLFMPLVLGKIMIDMGMQEVYDSLKVDVSFRHKETGELYEFKNNKSFTESEFEEVFDSNLRPREISRVKTIGGSVSKAYVIKDLHEYIPELEIDGDLDLNVNLIDVQRAGTLPSMITRWIFSAMGIDSRIISVDAKRAHKDDGTGVDHINIIQPKGYKASSYGQLRNSSFALPADYKESPDIHILFDPMLATGKSARVVLEKYCDNFGCNSEDIYVVSLFAGSYEGLNELSSLGVNIITLAHDQADLNIFKYIQPGLGDAGDKQAGEFEDGESKKINRETLSDMSRNLSMFGDGLKDVLNLYCLQLTGTEILYEKVLNPVN